MAKAFSCDKCNQTFKGECNLAYIKLTSKTGICINMVGDLCGHCWEELQKKIKSYFIDDRSY